MKIVFISNGHGEDAIAANLALQLIKLFPSYSVVGCPLVGNGHHYSAHNISVGLKNPQFPSGGFIRSLSVLLKDIKAGLLRHVYSQIKDLKQICDQADIVVCCGDVFCLVMGRLAHKNLYFLPTAKSETFMSHSFIEKLLIFRWSMLSFPRDELTTNVFKQDNLPAKYFGNPMMDNLVSSRRVILALPGQTVIGLLPGSRKEAIKNLEFMLQLCIQLAAKKSYMFLCAVSKNFSINELNLSTDWTISDHQFGTLATHKKNSTHVLFTYEFLAVINQSDLIIGLAGTANEQACFLNKPVVCFEGFGPQSSLQRFQEQRKLLGPLIKLSKSRDIAKITSLIETTLQVPIKSKPVIQQNASKDIVLEIIKDNEY